MIWYHSVLLHSWRNQGTRRLCGELRWTRLLPNEVNMGDNCVSFSLCINFMGIFLWGSLLLRALTIQIMTKTLLHILSTKNLPAPR